MGAGPAKRDARPSFRRGCDSLALGPRPRRRAGEEVNRQRPRVRVRPPRGALRPGPASRALAAAPPPRPRRFGQGSHAALPYVNPTPNYARGGARGAAPTMTALAQKKNARAVFSVAGSHINSHPRRRLFARIFSQTIPSHITLSHASFDLAYSIADRPRPLAPRGRRGPPNPRHHAAFETRRGPTI